MTKLLIEMERYFNGKVDGTWCDGCLFDTHMFKCRAAIARPHHIFLDDDIHRKRPIECLEMQVDEEE